MFVAMDARVEELLSAINASVAVIEEKQKAVHVWKDGAEAMKNSLEDALKKLKSMHGRLVYCKKQTQDKVVSLKVQSVLGPTMKLVADAVQKAKSATDAADALDEGSGSLSVDDVVSKSKEAEALATEAAEAAKAAASAIADASKSKEEAT